MDLVEDRLMRVPELQTTLYVNSVFSLLCAVVILSNFGWIATQLIALPGLFFVTLGVGLLLFAIGVFITALKLPASRSVSKLILYGDIAWVVATPIAMVFLAERITSLGYWVLIDIAVIVAGFAVLEWLGLKVADVSRLA
jgi:hypothetical protein|tara:strand:+ start:4061 stop:4480 length:420 start_codon:yes stop_codon:yes gene_type:complete